MTVAAPEDDKVMSFWEHLDELRRRLVRAGLAFVVGIFAAWGVKDRILAWLEKPFVDSWKAEGIPGEPELHFAAPGDAFMAYFKLSMIAGLGLAAPFIFWQLWAFVAPGLYRKEKRYAILFVLFSTLFFVGGALFGWRMAFPISFSYFLSLTKDAAEAGVRLHPTVMMGEYLDFASQMLLAFGIMFEMPLALMFLSMVGVVNYLQLLRFGRWAVMIMSVLAAVFSPPDTTSMIVMLVPMLGLYAVSVGLTYVFGKRPTPEQIERDKQWREERKLQKKAWALAREREKREAALFKRRAEEAAKKAPKPDVAKARAAKGR